MPDFGLGDEEYVESNYTVTIRNTGDERALAANDVQRLLEEFAATVLPGETIEIEVEGH